MKLRTCLTVIIAVGLFVGAFASHGHATCEKTVKVVEVESYDNGSQLVYGVELYQVLPGYYYFWTIEPQTSDNIKNAAQAAATSGRIARILGSATTCPTNGVNRYGGTVMRIRILK